MDQNNDQVKGSSVGQNNNQVKGSSVGQNSQVKELYVGQNSNQVKGSSVGQNNNQVKGSSVTQAAAPGSFTPYRSMYPKVSNGHKEVNRLILSYVHWS